MTALLRLVPDELWELVEPLLPPFTPGPQGGGTAPVDERAVFTAAVYVLTSGCAWRHLPLSFGVSAPTAHRRFHLDPDGVTAPDTPDGPGPTRRCGERAARPRRPRRSSDAAARPRDQEDHASPILAAHHQ